MRRSKWYVMVVYVLCVALLAGCSHTDTVEVGILTKEQALADYDYMWEVLENNYPSFYVTERMLGINKKRVKELNRIKLAVYPNENIPIEYLYEILDGTLNGFAELFHLFIIPPQQYKEMLARQSHDMDHSHTQFITDWDKSTAAYQYIDEWLHTEGINSPVGSSMTDNLSFEIINEHTAMIRIDSFSLASSDATITIDDILSDLIKQMYEYYERAADYDNLIIDISRNGGGSDGYWMRGIVAPNITERLYYTTTYLVKAGEENMQYMESRGIVDSDDLVAIEQSDLIQSLPNINEQDMEQLDYMFSNTNFVHPATGQKAYNGNLYVLIDKPVFSAAENFTFFCKQTGFASLVGRNSRGDKGFDPLLVSLPESGFIFQYSTFYALNEDGSNNQEFGTIPDYISADGETPLETALRVIEMRRGD